MFLCIYYYNVCVTDLLNSLSQGSPRKNSSDTMRTDETESETTSVGGAESPGVRRRRGSAGNTAQNAECHDVIPKYTQEQVEAVTK